MSMIKQWVYTTSCWNISGRGGWGTLSYTEGLDERDIEELERKTYVDNQTESAAFPVYSVLTLDSGKQVICQTVELGNSFYDGRPGALLTHAIIINAEEEWPDNPVAYFGSDIFWKALPERIIQEALYYRDNPEKMVPMPHLQGLDESKLTPNPDFSRKKLGELMQNKRFAENVSYLIEQLESLTPEQMPLQFTGNPSEFAQYLAVLCYLRPSLVNRNSVASICKTTGMESNYNFFSVVGTLDNMLIDLASPPPHTNALHPIVVLAQNDFEQACHFINTWGTFVYDNKETLSTVVKILSPDGVIDDALTEQILHLPANGLKHDALQQLIEAINAKPVSIATPKLILALFERIVHWCYSDELRKGISDAGLSSARALVSTLRLSVIQNVAQGHITAEEFIEKTSTIPLLKDVWLSTSQLELFAATASTPEKAANLLVIPITLYCNREKTAGTTPDWLKFQATDDLLKQVTVSGILLSQILTAASASRNLTFELCKSLILISESDEIVLDSIQRHLSQFDYAVLCSMINELIEQGLDHESEIFFEGLLYNEANYDILRCICENIQADEQQKTQFLQKAVQQLSFTPYTEDEGVRLLNLLESHLSDTLTEPLIQTINLAFPVEKLSPRLVDLANSFCTAIGRIPQFDGDYSKIRMISNIGSVLNESKFTDIKREVRAYVIPDLVAITQSTDDVKKSELIKSVLVFIISQTTQNPDWHAALLSMSDVWTITDLANAYKTIYEATDNPLQTPCAQNMFIAMLRVCDKESIELLMQYIADPLFKNISSRQIEKLDKLLSSENNTATPNAASVILHYADSNKVSAIRKIFNWFFN